MKKVLKEESVTLETGDKATLIEYEDGTKEVVVESNSKPKTSSKKKDLKTDSDED